MPIQPFVLAGSEEPPYLMGVFGPSVWIRESSLKELLGDEAGRLADPCKDGREGPFDPRFGERIGAFRDGFLGAQKDQYSTLPIITRGPPKPVRRKPVVLLDLVRLRQESGCFAAPGGFWDDPLSAPTGEYILPMDYEIPLINRLCCEPSIQGRTSPIAEFAHAVSDLAYIEDVGRPRGVIAQLAAEIPNTGAHCP